MRRVAVCHCAIECSRQRKIERIPPRYRWARLEILEAHPDLEKWGAPPELQARIIRLLQENAEDSFAFFGPAGVGKTTNLYALYRHAVESQLRACWSVQMARLVADLRSLEFGTEMEPCLSRRMIRDAHEERVRPRVFIDEFEKLNLTNFAHNAVGELIDETYKLSAQEGKGVQLVVATNLSREEFITVWGNHILRRIEEVCRVVDFFQAVARTVPVEAGRA